MASIIFLQTLIPAKTVDQFSSIGKSSFHDMCVLPRSSSSTAHLLNRTQLRMNKKKSFTVVAAVGDVSSEGTTYLIAGAAAVALLGTAFPILFSRRDTCPECDGAGFVRKAGSTLRANAARKDQAQIVCARCNGLGKLNQIDK